MGTILGILGGGILSLAALFAWSMGRMSRLCDQDVARMMAEEVARRQAQVDARIPNASGDSAHEPLGA